jgi:spermidine/putrescine transport system permease protein
MIALLTTVFALLIGYPFGYLLANTPKKRRAPLILLIMVPFWTNSLLRLTGWKILLQSDGIINTLLTSIGLIDADHRLMLMNNYVSVLVVTVYMLLPFMILPVYNSVDKLDKAVIEASKDLGAGRLRTFARVTLPLTVPGIASGVMLVFIPAIGIFFISDVIGDGKTMLLGNLIQNQFSFSRNWPFGAALSVIMITGMLIFVFLMLKASKNEEGGLINF